VPIHAKLVGNTCHWYLVVVDRTLEQIQILDSLAGLSLEKSYEQVADSLKKFFVQAGLLQAAKYRLSLVETPQQTNNIDCGVCVCRNMLEICTEQPFRSYAWESKIANWFRCLMGVQLVEQSLSLEKLHLPDHAMASL
jgi:Ulp1 family protease